MKKIFQMGLILTILLGITAMVPERNGPVYSDAHVEYVIDQPQMMPDLFTVNNAAEFQTPYMVALRQGDVEKSSTTNFNSILNPVWSHNSIIRTRTSKCQYSTLNYTRIELNGTLNANDRDRQRQHRLNIGEYLSKNTSLYLSCLLSDSDNGGRYRLDIGERFSRAGDQRDIS